jgi:hypothetical protein
MVNEEGHMQNPNVLKKKVLKFDIGIPDFYLPQAGKLRFGISV